MDVRIEESWKSRLQGEFEQDYFRQLTDFVRAEYAQTTVYPKGSNIFRAFDLCPFHQLKVVILGQDPYHEPGQAQGLAFSVPDGVKIPPSLVNIYKEIKDDVGTDIPVSGDLTRWTKQGVLLLNATLTVRAHLAGSHQRRGWEQFTDAIIRAVETQDRPIVYMLWGTPAQSKAPMVTNPKHLVLKAPHPSPLSAYRGFFGCRHFSQCNEFLKTHGETPVDWQL